MKRVQVIVVMSVPRRRGRAWRRALVRLFLFFFGAPPAEQLWTWMAPLAEQGLDVLAEAYRWN